MDGIRRVLVPGTPRHFDNAKAEKTFLAKPYKSFGESRIISSPYISNHPGEIVIRPSRYLVDFDDFGFELFINGRTAGSWSFAVFPGAPSFWEESGVGYHLHGNDFEIKTPFRRKNTPGNWFAAAFGRTIHERYLVPAYPEWILDTNTTSHRMNRVFAVAHGIERFVQHSETSWQPHAFLVSLEDIKPPTQ